MRVKKISTDVGNGDAGMTFVEMTPYEYADEMARFAAPRIMEMFTDEQAIDDFGLEVCDSLTPDQADELVSLFDDRLRYWLADEVRGRFARLAEKLDEPEFTEIISDLQGCV